MNSTLVLGALASLCCMFMITTRSAIISTASNTDRNPSKIETIAGGTASTRRTTNKGVDISRNRGSPSLGNTVFWYAPSIFSIKPTLRGTFPFKNSQIENFLSLVRAGHRPSRRKTRQIVFMSLYKLETLGTVEYDNCKLRIAELYESLSDAKSGVDIKLCRDGHHRKQTQAGESEYLQKRRAALHFIMGLKIMYPTIPGSLVHETQLHDKRTVLAHKCNFITGSQPAFSNKMATQALYSSDVVLFRTV